MSIYKSSSLAMIPTAYKDGKLYSVRPTDGSGDFTFSRGSNLAATRVDVNGLIEKGRENLLLQSNTFSNASWIKASGTSVTAGQSGYDGSTDAWLLNKTAAYARIEQVISFGGVTTAYVYAKASTHDWLYIRCDASIVHDAYFDLSTGSIGAVRQCIDTKIESIANGWYRCSITFNAGAGTYMRLYPSDSNNGVVNSTSGSIYIQDSQLESGLVSTSVIETTTTSVSAGILEDMPRLDYSGGASCPSLLLEPQRTNLAALSEYFEGWSHKVNITATSNYTTSPEGVQNATRLQFTANGFSYNINAPSQVNGAQHTLSCYAKRNDSGTQSFGFFTNGSGSVDSTMSLTSEWQRFTYTYTATNASQLGLAGLSGADVSVFGFQVEASASYATSYIPTYGTSQTRSLDNVNELTGVSDLIGQSEGTLFLDFVANDDDALQIIYQLRTTGSTNAGQIDFRIQSGLLRALGNDAGTTQFNISAGAAVAGTRYKCAVRYANNDVAFYVNGVLKGSDTNASFSSSALQQISFSENTGTFFPSASIKQALVFPTGLTNTELASLTTL